MKDTIKKINDLNNTEYKYGFITDIKEERIANGLNENVVKSISKIKNEPKCLLNWRLKAYKRWLEMDEPKWQKLDYPKIGSLSQG